MLLLLIACAQDVKTPTEPPKPVEPPKPAAPTLPEITPLPNSIVMDLDAPGGGAGAPMGVNAILPSGVQAEIFAGDVAPGMKGARLTVKSTGDALLCTKDLPFTGTAVLRTRLKLAEITPGPQDWNGMTVEMRSRDATGNLVTAPTMRYTPLKNYRTTQEWSDLEVEVKQVATATTGQFCYRFVESTGVVELDRIEFAPGATLGAPADGSKPADGVATPDAEKAPTGDKPAEKPAG